MIPFDLDDRVTAAAVAAAGTIIGALIQLRVAWRKEVSERARGVPMSKKSRRGPVLAVLLLVIAAGVAGFALSQYFLAGHTHLETAALRGELQAQLVQIRATAERLERATLNDRGPAGPVIDGRRGVDDVTVTTTVGPCRTRAAAAAAADAAPGCPEPDAPRVTLCASVPSSAVVTAVLLYARPEDAARPWTEDPVTPGQELGRARFAGRPYVRAESDLAKQVCTDFSAWDSERAYSARLVVKYASTAALRENTHAMVVPISETR